MKAVIGLVKGNCRRMIFSKVFLACVLGIAALEILDTLPHLLWMAYRDENNVLRFWQTVIGLIELGGATIYQLLVLCLCVLSASCGYCTDMESGTLNGILIRSSHKSYTAAAFLSCAFTAFLCVVLGEIIMTVGYRFVVPLHWEEAEMYQHSPSLLRSGHYYLYIAAHIIQRGLRGAFFAMISFMLSVFVKNKFMIVSIPVLLFYLFQHFGFKYLGVSFDFINAYVVYFVFYLETEALSLLHALCYTIMAGILSGLIFYKRLRRRC